MSKSKSRVKKKRPVLEADPFASSSPVSDAPSETPSQAALDAVSIPPAVTDDVSDEPFFSREAGNDDDDDLEGDDELRRERALRQTPEVKERIARARRIVTGLVAAAALVTFAGLGSKALRATPSAQASTSNALAAEPAKPAVAPEPAKPVEAARPAEPAKVAIAEPAKAPEPAAETKPAEAAKPAEPAAEPPKVAEAAKPAEAPAAPPVEPTGKTALEEKKEAQRLLDRGKSKDAIAAGERSVALDPADGEAWLLLGAAYQEQGKMADARRCYQACIKEGKRGPKGECAAMLR